MTKTTTPTPWPSSTPTATEVPGPLHASPEWVNFYGHVSISGNSSAPIGSTVDAYDPDGIRCGTYYVTIDGEYGFMPVYRDDTTTPEHDGALPGDQIRFAVNGLPAVPLGPDDTLWTSWRVRLFIARSSWPPDGT
jgi:hypothetical protein